jgi:hypothetical protein
LPLLLVTVTVLLLETLQKYNLSKNMDKNKSSEIAASGRKQQYSLAYKNIKKDKFFSCEEVKKYWDISVKSGGRWEQAKTRAEAEDLWDKFIFGFYAASLLNEKCFVKDNKTDFNKDTIKLGNKSLAEGLEENKISYLKQKFPKN